MSLKMPKAGTDDAELDVTSFLNLMIVLVPVLLLSMTFSKVSVLELQLPELTGGDISSSSSQSNLEVVIGADNIKVYIADNTLVKTIPAVTDLDGETGYDFAQLSQVMQALKQKFTDKRDVLIRLNKGVDYQHLVLAMDAVKSYKTVVVSSVVEIELFPEISLGDAS